MRRVVVVLLIIGLGGCDLWPFGPFDRRDSPPEDTPEIVHLATNFWGVLIPDRGKLYGCVWTSDLEGYVDWCEGMYEMDLATGEMRAIVDTAVSRIRVLWVVSSWDERYVYWHVEDRGGTKVVRMDLETGTWTSFPVPDWFIHTIVPSYESPDYVYVSESGCAGECETVFRVDFGKRRIEVADSLGFLEGYFVIPSIDGRDSIARVIPAGGGFCANVGLGLVLLGIRLYRYSDSTWWTIDMDPSEYSYTAPAFGTWVGLRDSALVLTRYFRGYIGHYFAERVDLWLVKGVSHLLKPEVKDESGGMVLGTSRVVVGPRGVGNRLFGVGGRWDPQNGSRSGTEGSFDCCRQRSSLSYWSKSPRGIDPFAGRLHP